MFIEDNPQLSNIEGLQNLNIIGRGLNIRNCAVSNLEGLNQLDTIGFGITLTLNPQLTDLTALSYLTTLGTTQSFQARINIGGNNALTTLDGLQNINPNTIDDLFLMSNQNLSICSLENICTYLEAGGDNNITNNASTCQSEIEVLNNCDNLSVDGGNFVEFVVFPNPADSFIIIKTDKTIVGACIYDLSGRKIKDFSNKHLDLSPISAGNYILEISTREHKMLERIVIN